MDFEFAWADPKGAPAAARQREPADEEVGAPFAGLDRHTDLLHRRIPCAALDQRDLPSSALIRAPDNALPRAQRGAEHGIHRPAMAALDPDGFETTHHHVGIPVRIGSQMDGSLLRRTRRA